MKIVKIIIIVLHYIYSLVFQYPLRMAIRKSRNVLGVVSYVRIREICCHNLASVYVLSHWRICIARKMCHTKIVINCILEGTTLILNGFCQHKMGFLYIILFAVLNVMPEI